MIDFITTSEKGVLYGHNCSIEAKKDLLPALHTALDYFKTSELDSKTAEKYVKDLNPRVDSAINRLSVKKNSTEYVFHSAFDNAVKEYFNGVKNNPIEEKIYLKNKKKYDAIVAKGQEPDWTLKPQVIVDLDLKRENICKVIEKLCASYENDIASANVFDVNAGVIEIIDFLKEQASRLVVKMNPRIAKAKAIRLLEEVGIPEPATRFNQYPFEFSGGMRQRIVIAIALSANPDILICDEPTTALDVTIQAQILELINKIKRERNLSVIFITHNLGVVANMADRIAVMYAGKIVEHGTAEEIFYKPAHPYTWALLSSMPDLETTERLESIPGTPPNMIYPPKGDAFAARNKYALEIDFELEPPLFEITPTHYAATWLLHPNAPKVEMPAIIRARIERMTKERN
ncbi:MAG: ABC transporter ATP-binding protein [Clostridia bacterium]|nr:ABC transporter ATP-binding protein [Clostridia bacterium]